MVVGLLAAAAVVGVQALSDGGGKAATSDRGSKAAKRAERLRQLQRKIHNATDSTPATSAASGTAQGKGGSFKALAAQLSGQAGIAYTSPGHSGAITTAGSLQTGSAWSTSKVPLAARVIKDAGGSGSLSSQQRSLISSALRASDNDAAMQLWDELVSRYGGSSGAARAVTQILRAAGDTTTTVSSVGRGAFSPYGQTEWSLKAQARFMASLAASCVPGSRYLLDQMSQVVSDQRWGLGTAGSRAFKGGWGPGTDGRYLVRQMGTLPVGKSTAVVTIAALPSDGQFATGQQMLDRIAQWAARGLALAPASGC